VKRKRGASVIIGNFFRLPSVTFSFVRPGGILYESSEVDSGGGNHEKKRKRIDSG
jgi:hypothetical protein